MSDSFLSIVIPCKNEEGYIHNLFSSLWEQNYDLSQTNIYLADAGSTDKTLEIVKYWQNYLNIKVIPGGFPSTARNNGAKLCKSKYILFLDADVAVNCPNLITNSLNLAETNNLDCVTCFIRPQKKDIRDIIFWQCHNLSALFARLVGVSAPGMMMLFNRQSFWEYGGFDEKVLVGEDLVLSSKVGADKFGVVPNFISTSSRRFKKDGYLQTIRFYTKTTWSRKNKEYFYQDHSFYWRD